MENPKIRFKGYTKDWEQRKFGELYSKVSEKNDLSFGADKIISVANMYFKEEVKESSDEYMRTYNVMRLGDIAFEGNKSKNYSHGRFVENTIGDGIVSHVFDVFRPTTSYDLLFWKYLINNEGVMGRIMARCTNASTMMTNLVASDFLKEKILVPSLKEQKKIGAYFDSLDHLITLHQRKCEQTKKLKKYMLQKMFPQNGAKVPEIRFDGFTYDWEQRKLIDVCDYVDYRGKTPTKTDSGVFLVTAKNVKDGYIDYGASQEYISEDDYEEVMHRGKPEIGDVLITTEAPCGNVAQVNRADIALAQRIIKYRGQSNIVDNTYLKYYLLSPEFQDILNAKSSGGTVKGIKGSVLHQQEIKYPKYEEQFKIGSYFNNLDHLITLHQRKCDELKKMKKYMLQNMFI